MPKVFISYRRHDTAGHAGRLYDRLKNEFGDDNVFMDVVTLTPGVDFRAAIRERVNASDAMIVLIGGHWLSPIGDPRLFAPDDVVRFELETALEHQIKIIPVVTDRAPMPTASDLPASVQAIAGRHAHELSNNRHWESDADELIKVLRRHALPRLEQRDLNGVRGFLPGKLLGRTTAVLSLALIVLGYVGAVDQMVGWLGSGLDAWLRGGLMFGLPLLAVAAQIGIEWTATRQRQRLRELAVQPAKVPQGYFRIGPYTVEDREHFDRADQAQRRAVDWIRRASHVPLYMTGDSGSGKSSLLNAFVLPTLRDEGWTVVEARAWREPEAALRDALSKALPNAKRAQLPSLSARALIEAIARRADAGLLVVLDQFEEFVILGEDEVRAKFCTFINELHTSPISNVRVLLVLRSDYEARIEECGLPLFRQGDNHLPIGRFTLAAAHGFMTRSSLGLSDVQLDRLLASAAALDQTPGLIRPVTLNVVGLVLSEGRGIAPSMDAETLIGSYIGQTLAQPAIRGHAPAVLEALITGFGTKRPISEPDLQKATNLRRGEVRAVLNGLAAAGMVRPLDSEHAVWELSHDFIARALAQQLRRNLWSRTRRVAAYAAPIVLTLAVSSLVTAAVWYRGSSHEVRSELAGLGLPVTVDDGKAMITSSSVLSPKNFAEAGQLLTRLNATTPVGSIDIPRTPIADLAPLQGLTALTSLNVSGTQINNLEPLKGLTKLTLLNVSRTQVTDLEPLKALTALTSLNVSETQVTDLEPLKALTALTSLAALDTPVASLDPLKGFTALTTLNVSETQVTDLEPLRGLAALTTLELYETRVAKLDTLKGLTALRTLNILGTRVESLEPLEKLTALRSLAASYTPVASLEPLIRLTALASLKLSGTQVADLKPLKGLTGLTSIDLSQTRVANLEPLKGLRALTSLDVSETQVANLEPLTSLTRLTSLNLSGTQVADLEPLKGLIVLTSLDLSATPVRDLTPLKRLPALTSLDLSRTQVASGGLLRDTEALAMLRKP